MSFLKDKEWENMDWLNKAVEPIVFSVNNEIPKLPSRIDIPASVFRTAVRRNENYLHVDNLIIDECHKLNMPKYTIDILYKIGFGKLYNVQSEPEVFYDVGTQTLRGDIYLVKQIETLDEEAIQSLLISFTYGISGMSADTANEIMDIIGCEEARKTKSATKKVRAIRNYMQNVFRENKWNIRNIDLCIKLVMWINAYLDNGNRAALANISKLKCMVYNGHPIYSMEEIV
jgi:ribosomal protein S13